jgi:short-subunit dehydrogenase
MFDALRDIDAAAPVDLVIANAGISSGLGPGRSPEPVEAARRVFAVHIDGMLNTLAPLLPGMIARGAGQIALMSSLAGSSPLADMPAYSASKAAIRAYGTSLRRWLKPQGISVSVICPGFVTTSMSARHRGYKPFEVPLDRSARRILKGLASREAYVTFPWQLALLVWLGNRLPSHLEDSAMTRFAAEIEPDGESQG